MRFSRSQLLPDAPATVHKYWRFQNRSYLLESDAAKATYLEGLKAGLTDRKSDGSPPSTVEVHAFGIMGNHTHESVSYKVLRDLSSFMQKAHGVFGARLNRMLRRTGPVGNERPRTSLVQNEQHAMRVHFYVEANPVRANLCKPENLKLYKWSSYRYYAFGIVDELTKILTPPAWYLKLGATPAERQSAYRSLFMDYYRSTQGDSGVSQAMKRYFIGDADWLAACFRGLRGGGSGWGSGSGQSPPGPYPQ